MVQEKITEADTPIIQLGATPSGLTSNPPPSSPIFYAGCPSCCNPPNYPGLEQAPNMLAFIPSGLKSADLCPVTDIKSNSNILFVD